MRLSLPLLLSVLAISSAASANDPEPMGATERAALPSEAAPTAPASEPLTLVLELDPRLGVDAPQLQARLHQELGHTFTQASPTPDGRIQIQQQGEDEVVVRYQLHGDAELVRSVALPKRIGERADVLFWLVSNLVTDQTGGLLAELAPHSSPPSAAAAPEDSAPANTKASPSTNKSGKPLNAPARATPRTIPVPKRAEKTPPLPPLELVNLSFFHPITLVPNSETRRFRGELGLAYSRVYGISGLGLTAGALRVDGPTEGALFAGLYAQWAGPTRGYVNSGLVSYATGPLVGAVSSGLLNVIRADATGAVLAGAVNVNQDLTGLQASGLLNIADHLVGAQASVVNEAQGIAGAQAGIVNVGGDVQGVQLGLVNISDSLTGMPIGLVNVVKSGRHQAQTWVTVQDTSDGYRSSLALGYKNSRGPLYTLVSLGMATSLEAKLADATPAATPTFATASSGMGAEIGVKPLYAAADIQYFVEADTRKSVTPRQGVESRATLGLDFGSIGVFAGVGTRQTFERSKLQLAPEAFAGLSLF